MGALIVAVPDVSEKLSIEAVPLRLRLPLSTARDPVLPLSGPLSVAVPPATVRAPSRLMLPVKVREPPLMVPPDQETGPLIRSVPGPVNMPALMSKKEADGVMSSAPLPPMRFRVAPASCVNPVGVDSSVLVALMTAPLLRLKVPEEKSNSGMEPPLEVVWKVPEEFVGVEEPRRLRMPPDCTSTVPSLLRSTKPIVPKLSLTVLPKLEVPSPTDLTRRAPGRLLKLVM